MSRSTGTGRSERGAQSRGEGWVVFAGIVFLVLGIVNIPYGIAAIGSSHFYTPGAQYAIGELKLWGWFIAILGAVQIVVAIGICRYAPWSRWAGVTLASLSAIIQLFAISGAPFLSLAVLAVDVLVIYALVVHGESI